MIRFARWLIVLVAVMMIPACGGPKQEATAAIKDAETAYAQIAEQARNVAPDEAKAIESGIAGAKASLAGGDAKSALTTAKEIGERVKTLAQQLPDLKAKLEDDWKDLNTSVPGAIAGLEKKLHDFGRPPEGMPGRSQFDAATAAVAPLGQQWDAARALYDGGQLAAAVAKAEQVKADAVKMLADMQTGS
jgi:hypothetical protein